jgi:hypothetical protein
MVVNQHFGTGIDILRIIWRFGNGRIWLTVCGWQIIQRNVFSIVERQPWDTAGLVCHVVGKLSATGREDEGVAFVKGGKTLV